LTVWRNGTISAVAIRIRRAIVCVWRYAISGHVGIPATDLVYSSYTPASVISAIGTTITIRAVTIRSWSQVVSLANVRCRALEARSASRVGVVGNTVRTSTEEFAMLASFALHVLAGSSGAWNAATRCIGIGFIRSNANTCSSVGRVS